MGSMCCRSKRDTDSGVFKVRSTDFAAALVLRPLVALGAPNHRSGVSLICRNDYGVNALNVPLA